MSLAEVRKFIVAVCGALVVIGNTLLNTTGLLPDTWAQPINIAVVAATALLTYLVPNQPPTHHTETTTGRHAKP